MGQVMGIILVLFGSICFHLAASKKVMKSPFDVWKDMLDTISNPGGTS